MRGRHGRGLTLTDPGSSSAWLFSLHPAFASPQLAASASPQGSESHQTTPACHPNRAGSCSQGALKLCDSGCFSRRTTHMKDYEAVLGCHPDHANVFIFNGLGSHETLKAPRLAVELQQLMNDHVPAARSDDRLMTQPATDHRPKPLTQRAQEVIASVLQRGDTAFDATVGNGFDTCFLSRTVGPTGRVIGVDVQQSALDATRKRLQAEDLHNVTLLHQGHETMAVTLAGTRLSAVMFNPGLPPRRDHSVTTQPHTSTAAIAAAVDLLIPGGVLTILAYRGHPGGPEEFAAVEQYLLAYSDRHELQQIDSTPAKPTSPVLFVLKRL